MGSGLDLFRGFRIGLEEVEVSHLQFVDDTILFCEPETGQVRNFKAILRCYELISGQKSNFHKSKFFALNIPEERAQEIAVIMGCQLDSLPSSVSLMIEQIQRRFLWGGNEDKRGIALVKWEEVCVPIKLGGLGIRRIRDFNHALLGKCLWRFGDEHDRWWVKVISSNYGCDMGRWESLDLEAFVSDCFEWNEGVLVWNPGFRRSFFEWEVELFSSLRALLEGYYIKRNGEDKRLWIEEPSGPFSVKSFYKSIMPISNPSYSAKERNSRVFEEKAMNPHWIYLKIITLVISWVRCLPSFWFVSAFDLWEGWRDVCFSVERIDLILQRWKPHAQNMYKLNFDGASSGNPGPQEWDGFVTMIRGMLCGHTTALLVCLIPQMRKWGGSSMEISFHFDEIEDLTAGSAIGFQHVRRSANDKADALAKRGVSGGSIIWFDHLPP
ncbi:uncharacterized protein LOC143859117 [Tasmannia lanceolata]|uniref:uncharacterized protein LOC143859117 n=1 Tax=Tasmannia lanceolata TaxID=3420 RepID=UPI00406490DD